VTSKRLILAAALVLSWPDLGSSEALAASKQKAAPRVLRLPYDKTQTYHVKLMPGAPFRVDLPAGEEVQSVICDLQWWSGEGVPGRPILIIRTSDTRGGELPPQALFSIMHVETKPSRLMLSFTLERVDVEELSEMPAIPVAMELYLAGSALVEKANQSHVNDAVAKEMPYLEREIEEKNRAKYAEMYRRAVSNLRDDYDIAGDFTALIGKVVDDRVRTTINMKKASEKVVLLFEDKDGKRQPVNYEIENGMFIVQKVLRPGQKFRLVLGKEESWIALK
jgi:hypothetical protein